MAIVKKIYTSADKDIASMSMYVTASFLVDTGGIRAIVYLQHSPFIGFSLDLDGKVRVDVTVTIAETTRGIEPERPRYTITALSDSDFYSIMSASNSTGLLAASDSFDISRLATTKPAWAGTTQVASTELEKEAWIADQGRKWKELEDQYREARTGQDIAPYSPVTYEKLKKYIDSLRPPNPTEKAIGGARKRRLKPAEQEFEIKEPARKIRFRRENEQP